MAPRHPEAGDGSSETYPSERRCPACDAPCVVRDGGCPTCHACGWSKCAYSPP